MNVREHDTQKHGGQGWSLELNAHIIYHVYVRKTSCASRNFYFENKRVTQLGFPRKPSCANVKFYL